MDFYSSEFFPHDYVLRKQEEFVGEYPDGYSAFHTTTFYGNVFRSTLERLVREGFPHDYVLRKRPNIVQKSRRVREAFHTTTFYGNWTFDENGKPEQVPLSTRLRSTETPIDLTGDNTLSIFPHDYVLRKQELYQQLEQVKSTFHTTTFYGNLSSFHTSAPFSLYYFPHDYVLRKRERQRYEHTH
ncbi:hypothetical protein PYCH_14050 [Pyrococcus yayanosii CH1]|uniref:Uncharacterized protein n=1 Tax=Pyrococcus yayanosii (strain CH1 / JCM 16557) TaxID=529709 RepID=F8AG21_PYRYC|nr:hypothetical protein PYCH_14050 [Pyrococcus yayanosii CH1]